MKWSAVILAAGNGVRMKSATPKPLHRVSGIPMLKYVSDAARAAGVADITVVVATGHAESAEFRSAAGDDARLVVQTEQKGTADALLAAREAAAAADAILILYGDTPLITPETVRSLISEHEKTNATVTLATASHAPVDGLGRIVRDQSGEILAIVEQEDADDETLAISEVNAGWYGFDANWIWDALAALRRSANGEYYLTDAIEAAVRANLTVASVSVREPSEILGVNTRSQLAMAEATMRQRQRDYWMDQGVTLIDPAATYIDASAILAPDVTIHPNSHILGTSTIAAGCEIGPDSIVIDTTIGEDSRFVSSHAEGATIGKRVSVGPFSRLRPGAVLDNDVYIGNYAEIKNSSIGPGTHVGHFSYVGDAELGKRVNIGAGAVTANYDGKQKHRTVIGDDAFVGSGSMLVAPVQIGRGAVTGAGSVVTHDVPAGDTVAGVPARPVGDTPGTRRDDSPDHHPHNTDHPQPDQHETAARTKSDAATGDRENEKLRRTL
ncbi:MAG: bifunctional UDP-N-acetylglucosamine diphosphorylase/glucosamine-1-phosphate N-acetyltransferase GlmU [Chloroflexi bacterium]|nr:bifunctional UDP-N-acetylglucosamine diphosphorylase/glucosamine-1-phosphate N-acetyltransferase GlmU [Chloroflexota bacterium]